MIALDTSISGKMQIRLASSSESVGFFHHWSHHLSDQFPLVSYMVCMNFCLEHLHSYADNMGDE